MNGYSGFDLEPSPYTGYQPSASAGGGLSHQHYGQQSHHYHHHHYHSTYNPYDPTAQAALLFYDPIPVTTTTGAASGQASSVGGTGCPTTTVDSTGNNDSYEGGGISAAAVPAGPAHTGTGHSQGEIPATIAAHHHLNVGNTSAAHYTLLRPSYSDTDLDGSDYDPNPLSTGVLRRHGHHTNAVGVGGSGGSSNSTGSSSPNSSQQQQQQQSLYASPEVPTPMAAKGGCGNSNNGEGKTLTKKATTTHDGYEELFLPPPSAQSMLDPKHQKHDQDDVSDRATVAAAAAAAYAASWYLPTETCKHHHHQQPPTATANATAAAACMSPFGDSGKLGMGCYDIYPVADPTSDPLSSSSGSCYASLPSSSTEPITCTSALQPLSSLCTSSNTNNNNGSNNPPPPPVVVNKEPSDPLQNFTLSVPGVSLQPMSGQRVLDTVRQRTDEVVTRYLPCVDFLVACQQELRAGLAAATKKRMINRHTYRDSMTPRQFYQRYLQSLPDRFYRQNHHIMEGPILSTAYGEIQKLCVDAKRCEFQGCEAMKNAFLGGMRDGESWGLRRWLSRNGGALKICNDLELISAAVRKLDRKAVTSVKLSESIRPMAKQAFDRLKNDIPAAYQEHSSAHPYLPFFHRLEAALGGLSNYDPDDEDVICLDSDDDDDDDEVEEIKSAPLVNRKEKQEENRGRKRTSSVSNGGDDSAAVREKRTRVKDIWNSGIGTNGETEVYGVSGDSTDHGTGGYSAFNSGNLNDDEGDSDIEVVAVKPPGGQEIKDVGTFGGSLDAGVNRGALAGSPSPAAVQQPPKPQQASKPSWRCRQCTFLNVGTATHCAMCEDDDGDSDDNGRDGGSRSTSLDTAAEMPNFEEAAEAAALALNSLWQHMKTEAPQQKAARPNVASSTPSPTSDGSQERLVDPHEMMDKLEELAQYFDSGRQREVRPRNFFGEYDFWNTSAHYAYVLRLFKSIISRVEASRFLGPVDEDSLFLKTGWQYSDIVKNPLCFQDIVYALVKDGEKSTEDSREWNEGRLSGQPGIRHWNMWNGRDLLEAIDLVFINSLAFTGKTHCDPQVRHDTFKLRKLLWNGIQSLMMKDDKDTRRRNTPTKRGETSGFVVYKR